MQPASTQTNTAEAATVWDIDPAHSAAEFAVKHLMIATVKGAVAVKGGTIRFDPADPASTRIEAVLDAASIDTRAADRDTHLRSADFLDADDHPTLTFVSTRVEAVDGSAYRITGDLTIRGVTRPVVLEAEFEGEATDPWGNRKAAATATTTLDRREWGLTWNAALEAGGFLVGDKVKVTLHVQAARRS